MLATRRSGLRGGAVPGVRSRPQHCARRDLLDRAGRVHSSTAESVLVGRKM